MTVDSAILFDALRKGCVGEEENGWLPYVGVVYLLKPFKAFPKPWTRANEAGRVLVFTEPTVKEPAVLYHDMLKGLSEWFRGYSKRLGDDVRQRHPELFE